MNKTNLCNIPIIRDETSLSDEKFAVACSEMTEILKCSRKSDVDKIPIKLQELFVKNSKKDYVVKFDFDIPVEEQISEETKDFLGLLYCNYLGSEQIKKDNPDLQLNF